ncbi:MAG: 2'-5' RNA ligase family protein [Opitutus sp.]
MLPASNPTQRFFVELPPPESVCTFVAGLGQPYHGVRWTPVAQFYVTLRFLGEIERERQDALLKRFAEIRLDPFPLAVEGVGAWARTYRDFAGPVFSVDAFDVYASELHPTGAEHRLVAQFSLTES